MNYLYKVSLKYFKIIDFYILKSIISIVMFSSSLFLIYIQKDKEVYQ